MFSADETRIRSIRVSHGNNAARYLVYACRVGYLALNVSTAQLRLIMRNKPAAGVAGRPIGVGQAHLGVEVASVHVILMLVEKGV